MRRRRCSKWAASRRSTSRSAAAAGLALATQGDVSSSRIHARHGARLPAAIDAAGGSIFPLARQRCAKLTFRRRNAPAEYKLLNPGSSPPIFRRILLLELGLELKRRRMKERKGIAFATKDKVREAIRECSFHPRRRKSGRWVRLWPDMRAPSPNAPAAAGRCGLWQKRLSRFQAMLVAGERLQAALMAPTGNPGHAAFSRGAQAIGALQP